MPDTIGIKRRTGADDYGKPTYAAVVNYDRCRDMRIGRLLALPNGTVFAVRGKAMFSTAPEVETDDMIVLPDGQVARVIIVTRPRDGIGTPHHTTVEYG